jgi:hypothetical protein
MRRGAVKIERGPWRVFERRFASGDMLYFIPPDDDEGKLLIRHGDVRDAFHCESCGTTTFFDGRKVSPG